MYSSVYDYDSPVFSQDACAYLGFRQQQLALSFIRIVEAMFGIRFAVITEYSYFLSYRPTRVYVTYAVQVGFYKS
uniref:Uncharacterized protein n=1 Tax=Glossina brevipalpis TaxID=37001 RepID=A0A1A9WHK9_9MUSC